MGLAVEELERNCVASSNRQFLLCDLNLADIETCYEMVRTPLLRNIPLESSDFRIEVELTIKLAKRSVRIFEVPIRYSGRNYEEGKKINWRDGLRALLGRRNRQHDRPSGAPFGVLGDRCQSAVP